MVDFSLGVTVNSAINSFVRDGIGMLSCIYLIFELLVAIKVTAAYYLGHFNWSISLSIDTISKYLASSGPKWQVIVSKSAIIQSGL